MISPKILTTGRTIQLESCQELNESFLSFVYIPDGSFNDWYNSNCMECERLLQVRTEADLSIRGGCILNEVIQTVRLKKEKIILELSEKNIILPEKRPVACKLKI